MSSIRRLQLLIFIVVLAIFTSACSKQSQESQIEKDINFLCSEDCGGRLVGSEGNQTAMQYIADIFQERGLEFLPGNDSYEIPYVQEIFNPEEQNQTLTAIFSDGSETVYFAGKDYYPYLGLTNDFTGQVTTDHDDPTLSQKILLTEPGGTARGKRTILRTEVTNISISHLENTVFYLNPELFDQLVDCESIKLEGDPVIEEAEVSNLAGVLKGKDSTQALIIAAHFDHLGRYGDTLYQGALDNASGTAAMLETLRLLTENKTQPAYDVVFVGFNGEEMLLQGSSAFSELELPYENVNVVSLDCVGLDGVESIGLSEDELGLAKQMADFFQSQGETCRILSDYMGSDHLSFQEKGIPSVNISCDVPWGELSASVNVPNDPPERLDFRAIERLSQLLTEYAMSPNLIKEQPPEEPEILTLQDQPFYEEVYQRGMELIEQLHPDITEEIPFECSGGQFVICDFRWSNSVSNARDLIPDAYFPEQLGAFRLQENVPLCQWPNLGEETDRKEFHLEMLFPETDTVWEKPRPISTPQSWYSLSFLDMAGTSIELHVYNREYYSVENFFIQGDEVTSEELENGATLYRSFRTLPEGQVQYGAVYDYPDSPCLFALYLPVVKDVGEDWGQLLQSSEEELLKMRNLP